MKKKNSPAVTIAGICTALVIFLVLPALKKADKASHEQRLNNALMGN